MGANRITEPEDVDHPELREMAETARWVARLAEARDCAEDMVELMQADDDPSPSSARPDEETPWELISSLVEQFWEDADRALEARLIDWLAKDPEHWPIYRLVVLDPWRIPEEGRWRDDTPGWVQALSINAALAHYQQDPYGRRQIWNIE